jgi:hypothetical protein
VEKPRLISALAALGLASTLHCSVRATDTAQPRLYEMTTETLMPHLEENLRYATRREKRCLSTDELSAVFWMLGEASLHDCTLVKSNEQADSATYRLQCNGGHGTTGDARWKLGPGVITGTLKVRLGGKNMTFYQRITAKPVGDCS